jgi:hypothetical protein
VNGNATGYFVNYTSARLVNVTTLTVQLRAASPTGLTTTNLHNYTVDAVAPNITHNLTGNLTIANVSYAVSTTRITLNASDPDGTPPRVTYSVNGGDPVTYTGPITPTGADGQWLLTYTATDAAENAAVGTVALTIDRTGPVITVAKNGDEILLTVSDAGVGLDEGNVTVFYKYGEASSYTPTKLTRLTVNSYRVQLTGNATTTGLKYYFEAKDVLGNVGAKYSAAAPFVILKEDNTSLNHEPKVRILAPNGTDALRGSVELEWIAEDPDTDPLLITIALRDPTGSGKFLVQAGENTGKYTVNLTGLAAGSYTLIVTATDETASGSEQVTFLVAAGKVIELREPPDSSVEPNQKVRFAVSISPSGKAVKTASYNVTRDGTPVTSGALTAQSGAYAGNIVPTEPGKYVVFVSATYDDGTSEPSTQVATFTVTQPPVAPAAGIPASFIALLAVSVITIALAAYGAFVRWSK